MATHGETTSQETFSVDSLSPSSDQFIDIASIKDEAMLKQVLLKQLEYYFSRKNLATDSFLVSQMNAELFVPVSIVAQFAKIQALTTDESLLLDVMKSSPHLIIDEVQRRVRPNFQVQRNTLILRDIPSDANPSAVEQLFKGEGLPLLRNIKPEIGNTWFATFDTETEALDMLNYIRGKKFNGQPIGCRLKSENLLKSFRESETKLEANAPLKGGMDKVPSGEAHSSLSTTAPPVNAVIMPQATYYYPGMPVAAPYMMDYYGVPAGYPGYPPMPEHARYPVPSGAYHGNWKYRGGVPSNLSYNAGYHGEDGSNGMGGGNRHGGQYYHQRPYHQRSNNGNSHGNNNNVYRQRQWKNMEERKEEGAATDMTEVDNATARSSLSQAGNPTEHREVLEKGIGSEAMQDMPAVSAVNAGPPVESLAGSTRSPATRHVREHLDGYKAHPARENATFSDSHSVRSASRESEYKKSNGPSHLNPPSLSNRKKSPQSPSMTASAPRPSGSRVMPRRNSQPQFAPDSFPSLTNGTATDSDAVSQRSSRADGQKAYSAVAAENARSPPPTTRPSASPSKAVAAAKKPMAAPSVKAKVTPDRPNIRMDELSLAQDLIAPSSKAVDGLTNQVKETLSFAPTLSSSLSSLSPISSSPTNASVSPSSSSTSPSSTPTKTATSSYAEILRKSKSNAVPLSAASTSA